MGVNHSEIALFCYQTIPRKILHWVSHEWSETDDGPKTAFMRPRPFVDGGTMQRTFVNLLLR